MLPISDKIFVNGELLTPHTSERLDVLNPSTGKFLGRIPDCSAEDVEKAVASSSKSFEDWKDVAPREKGKIFLRLANLLRSHTEELATLDTQDTGRTLAETTAQVNRSAEQLEYCAGAADKLEGSVVSLGQGNFSATIYEPFGVIGILTPWNAPLLQITQKASQALIVGNSVVVKPSPLACFSTFYFAQLAKQAGLPDGLLNIVTGGPSSGSQIVKHKMIKKITFTGSSLTGRTIAGECGARGVSASLELGGKCPLIILDDANLEKAPKGAVTAAFGTTGQSCVSAARVLIQRNFKDIFVPLLIEQTSKLSTGDPFDPTNDFGPLITSSARQRICELVEDALNSGANLVFGKLPDNTEISSGFFMDPIILSDVPHTARIVSEEIFGPVTCLEFFDDDDEAISLANAGDYGLASGVYTQDTGRARRFQSSLKAGNVWVNCYKQLDPALPFGGVKDSGISRECGMEGILNFTQSKTLVEMY